MYLELHSQVTWLYNEFKISKFFSTFPRGTWSPSVSGSYLALCGVCHMPWAALPSNLAIQWAQNFKVLFNTFPCGTCSLSVSGAYLALCGVCHAPWAAHPSNLAIQWVQNFKVLFNFPLRYLFTISLGVIFSLMRSLPHTLSCTPK